MLKLYIYVLLKKSGMVLLTILPYLIIFITLLLGEQWHKTGELPYHYYPGLPSDYYQPNNWHVLFRDDTYIRVLEIIAFSLLCFLKNRYRFHIFTIMFVYRFIEIFLYRYNMRVYGEEYIYISMFILDCVFATLNIIHLVKTKFKKI